MIKRRTPQYPREAFLEAQKLKRDGVSYNGIIEKMKVKYPKLRFKQQAIRLVKYPIEAITEKT